MAEYKFNEEEWATINEYDATIQQLMQQRNGALRLIAKQNHLEGNWDVKGNKLVKQEEQHGSNDHMEGQ